VFESFLDGWPCVNSLPTFGGAGRNRTSLFKKLAMLTLCWECLFWVVANHTGVVLFRLAVLITAWSGDMYKSHSSSLPAVWACSAFSSSACSRLFFIILRALCPVSRVWWWWPVKSPALCAPTTSTHSINLSRQRQSLPDCLKGDLVHANALSDQEARNAA
jgi:hypothetical protein